MSLRSAVLVNSELVRGSDVSDSASDFDLTSGAAVMLEQTGGGGLVVVWAQGKVGDAWCDLPLDYMMLANSGASDVSSNKGKRNIVVNVAGRHTAVYKHLPFDEVRLRSVEFASGESGTVYARAVGK
jgi:hypothetical protein